MVSVAVALFLSLSNAALIFFHRQLLLRIALLLLAVAGAAGQTTCCTGTVNTAKGTIPATGTQCTSTDSGYTWTMKTCDSSTTCRSYKCTVSAIGMTLDALVYQGCFSDATYQTAMTGSSINGYKCTSDASRMKLGVTGLWLGSAVLMSVIYLAHA